MASGAEAVDHVRRDADVAVVVAGSTLSDMSGFEASSRVVDEASAVRCILATGELSDDVREALDGGKVHTIAPMDEEALLAAAVRDALERGVLEANLKSANSQLELLRSELEDRVVDRTDQLEMKVRELEGRSRIAQHLLRVHTMDGTLEEVLKVADPDAEPGMGRRPPRAGKPAGIRARRIFQSLDRIPRRSQRRTASNSCSLRPTRWPR